MGDGGWGMGNADLLISVHFSYHYHVSLRTRGGSRGGGGGVTTVTSHPPPHQNRSTGAPDFAAGIVYCRLLASCATPAASFSWPTASCINCRDRFSGPSAGCGTPADIFSGLLVSCANSHDGFPSRRQVAQLPRTHCPLPWQVAHTARS